MKKHSVIVTSVMATLLLGLSAATWTKAPDLYSDSERRELAKKPVLSMETVLDGSFMEKFESYTQDQFPFREMFRSIKAQMVFEVLDQKDNNDIYVEEGHISKLEYPLNTPMLDHAADRFNYLYETYLQDANKLYLAIVPDKNYFLAKKHGYLTLDYPKFIHEMKDRVRYMEYLDVTHLLALEDYYTTDTHWRQENLLDVAHFLLDKMNPEDRDHGGHLEPEKLTTEADSTEKLSAEDTSVENPATESLAEEHPYQVNQLDHPFYGVYYGQSALPMDPDAIQYLTSDLLDQCIVISYDTGVPVEIPMYDMEKATGKDPYEMFLSGTRAILTIENPMAEEVKELIVFRDSFGSSLIPLLMEEYSKITVLDIRYVNSSILGQYVDFGNQDVLFLYSTMMLNNSLALK